MLFRSHQIIPARRRCPDRSESSELRVDPGPLAYGAYSRGILGTAGNARAPVAAVGVRGSVYAERSNSSDMFDPRTCELSNLLEGGGGRA